MSKENNGIEHLDLTTPPGGYVNIDKSGKLEFTP